MRIPEHATNQQLLDVIKNIASEYLWSYLTDPCAIKDVLGAMYEVLSDEDKRNMQKDIDFFTDADDNTDKIELGQAG